MKIEKEKKDVFIILRVPRDYRTKAIKEAKRQGYSLAELIRKFIDASIFRKN